MLTSVKIIDNSNTPLWYIEDIPLFKNGKEFKFKPGINIIIGPNGSGKSTLMELISNYLFCSEGMYSVLPKTAIEYPHLWKEIGDKGYEEGELRDGIEIKHDYRSICFRLRPASDFKSQEHDKSFESFSLMYSSKSASVGEQTLEALGYLFKLFESPKISYEFPIKELTNLSQYSNDLWKKRFINLIEYYKKNSIKIKQEDFQFTILMDEPDRNLDIDNIDSIYNILSFQKPMTQVIAVIHNPVLIYKLSKLNYINWIETKRGYLNKIKKFIEQ